MGGVGCVPGGAELMGSYVYDPSRRILSVHDSRLNRMLVRDAYRYASLTEYATGSGLPVDRVVALLGDFLDEGSLGLEVVGGDTFLLTAPAGRPIPDHLADVAPNLWETLRQRSGLEEAHALWRITRSLERAGWVVEAEPSQLVAGLGHVSEPPLLGVLAAQVCVPLVVGPTEEQLVNAMGPLAEYDRAGAAVVGVACPAGTLDRVVTAVRRWVLSRRAVPSRMTVMVLEAPRYQPVLLSAADSAVEPRSVTRSTLETFDWGLAGG